MGFWGGLLSKAKKAKEWAGEKFNEVKERVCEKGVEVKKAVTNQWNKFSGKNIFDEADALYKRIEERYHKRKKKFEQQVNEYANKIERHVESINKSKDLIKLQLLPEMAKKIEKIKDVKVSEDFKIEEYINEVKSFDQIRSQSQLYKIDFNKHKFKTNVQAVFTLGFYTRKKAKETLYEVQEEEKKIDAEIAKMDAEIKKLEMIESSLGNVEHYFTSLIELYGTLLVRLDVSVNYLFVRCMSFAHKLVHTEMSVKRLPKMQQKEIEAIMTVSKILSEMTQKQIVSLENADGVSDYGKKMKGKHDDINKVHQAA